MIATSAFPFLAPLGAGELIGHYILRNAGYSSSASRRMVFEELLNQKPGLHGMPNGLGRFHQVVGHLLGSLDMLLDEHTELNWYCRGLPPEKYERQRRNLIEKLNGPVRLCRPEVTLGATDGVARYCPECDEQQLHDYGFRYVHRELCAPYVTACSKHGLELLYRGKQGRLFDADCCHPLSPGQLQMAVQFARRTAHCLNTAAEIGSYTKADTLRRLMEAGYLSATGRLAVGDTIRTFVDMFGDAFPDERMHYMCSSAKCISGALRNLMRAERAVFPVYGILLSWMAEERVRPTGNKSVSVRTTKRHVLPTLSADQVRVAMVEHGTLTAASRVLGVNMKKLTALCLLHGVPINRRAKTLDPVLWESVHAAFDAGLAPSQVVKRYGVSLSTAHWIRTCRADLMELKSKPVQRRAIEDRALWEQVLLANPGKTTTELRTMNYSLWTRLRRNSFTWLQEHRAPPSAVRAHRRNNWPKPLTQTLNKSVRKAASACEKEGKLPLWKTLGRLQRTVGITEYQMRRFHEATTIDGLLESNSTFVRRRLEWADPSPGKLKSWRAARKAGLRATTISGVRKLRPSTK